MIEKNIQQINIEQILKEKAPSISKKVPQFVVNYLKRTVHQDELNYILENYSNFQGVDFMNKLIEYFQINLVATNLNSINTDKRYIFASNHPLGGLDGICLSAVIGNHFKGEIRCLVNDLLLYIKNLNNIFIPINKHGAQKRSNAELIEEAFNSNNQILTFPAGLCSRKIKGKIIDLEWKKSFIQKAIKYQRDIIPIFFDGKNSSFFYNFAHFRKMLGIKMNYEMIYLPDEMFRCKQHTYQIYFGEPIPWQTFDKRKNIQEWADYVKDICYKLKD